MEEKSIIELRLEAAKKMKNLDKHVKTNKPNMKLIAEAIYNHVYYYDI